jgi:hypothetical protein
VAEHGAGGSDCDRDHERRSLRRVLYGTDGFAPSAHSVVQLQGHRGGAGASIDDGELRASVVLGFFTPPVPKPEALPKAESSSTHSRISTGSSFYTPSPTAIELAVPPSSHTTLTV